VSEDSLKLTTYFGEHDRLHGRYLAGALIDLYARHEVRASILLRGALGFGERHHLRTDRLLTLSEDLPAVAVAVDTRERIEALMPEIEATRGFVTLERARLLAGDLEAAPFSEPTKLTLYLGRGEPFAEACELLRRHGVAGASVLLGVDGTAHGERRRARFLGRNAGVPLMLIAVGDAAAVARALPELDGLLHRPLATLERVRVCRRDGEHLAEPHAQPGGWQKLMVYTSEYSAIHLDLIERLRASGARGATVLRGIWGYHGDHPPHGDRLLQLRRHVPVVTVLVDTADRIAATYEIVEAVTRERGLVTSEVVPRLAVLKNVAPMR
jgi:PII-like signaling protein